MFNLFSICVIWISILFRISIFGFRIYIGILGGSLMATKAQILANRIELRNTQYETRYTPHAIRESSIQNRAMIYAKQTQFAGHSNEHKLR